MAKYTKVNLAEVEDSAPKFGMPSSMHARFASQALGLEKSGISYFKYTSGLRVPFGHKHTEQEEIYVLLSGSARLKVDDDILDLKPLDAVRVPPQTIRNFEIGPKGAEILAYGAPRTGPGDGELIHGWWK
jgi:mannose-6-phosphate isomerase-like protein (cupin superfamily)